MKEIIKNSNVTIYNTAIGSLNTGDQIIQESALLELENVFPDFYFHHFPTHLTLGNKALKSAWANDKGFILGTNLLRNKVRFRGRKNQWAINFYDCLFMKPAILMGVGWNKYSAKIDWKSKFFYKRALSKDYKHSVRDNYTKQKLCECGIENVINTGCPSLWCLSEKHIDQLPTRKARNVVFTLTDNTRSIEEDWKLIDILLSHYEEVLFWPQGSQDLEYFQYLTNLKKNTIQILNSHLNSLDSVLNLSDIEYVGTRLHAGIRAIQKKKRSLIISIDNRATEMHRDFNLPVIGRNELDSLPSKIETDRKTSLNIPFESIKTWKDQFIHI